MISHFMGIEYGRGACAKPQDGGPALAPHAVKEMFPLVNWNNIANIPVDIAACVADRFAENALVQRRIYDNTPRNRHIMIGGDHSVNFGHFAALADQIPDTDLCMVYVDAHLDIHTPESSRAQASGAPHGCNVRGLLGDGDARWLAIPTKKPSLRPENIFYIGTRSFEPAELDFVRTKNIFIRYANELQTMDAIRDTVATVRKMLSNRPFVLSFDFDSIDPKFFPDTLVPEENGITVDAAKCIVHAFADAYGIEFVEYAPNGDQQSADIVRQLITIAMNG